MSRRNKKLLPTASNAGNFTGTFGRHEPKTQYSVTVEVCATPVMQPFGADAWLTRFDGAPAPQGAGVIVLVMSSSYFVQPVSSSVRRRAGSEVGC